MTTRLFATSMLAIALGAAMAAPADAQHRRGGGPAVSGRATHAVPAPPRTTYGGRYYPYRYPYRYGYGPRFNLALGFGYPFGYPYGYYGYYGWGYPYGYGYPYAYGYPYGSYGYPAYAYGSPAYGYGGAGHAYGSVKIADAPKDAEVFVDGYYAGIADDFDGSFQHLDLEAGPHKIEVRAPGLATTSFDVNVTPYRTITFHARVRPAQP